MVTHVTDSKLPVIERYGDLSPNDMIALRPVSEIDVVMADDVMLEGGSLHQEPGSLLIQPVWR